MPLPNMPRDGSAGPMQVLRPGVSQTIAFTDANTTVSMALASTTKVIRLSGDVDVHYTADGAAALISPFLMAGAYEYIAVADGDSPQFLAPSGAGSLNLTEMA